MCDGPPEDAEPETPPRDVLDFIDQTVAQITDTDIEARLRRSLTQDHPAGSLWDMPGDLAGMLTDLSAQVAAAETATVHVEQARAAARGARLEAAQIAAEAQEETDKALTLAAQMIRDAREKAARMIRDASQEAAQIIEDSLAQANGILETARRRAQQPLAGQVRPGAPFTTLAYTIRDESAVPASAVKSSVVSCQSIIGQEETARGTGKVATREQRVAERVRIGVPERFADDTLAREGEVAREWLESLPDLVGSLCRRWDLCIDGQPMHGYLGLVVPVTRDGERCALKISWVCEETLAEGVALSVWDGDGAVRMLAEDRVAGAKLLERLNSRRSLNGQSLGVAVPVAGRLLRRLAVPVPATAAEALPSLGAWAARLSAELPGRWQAIGEPFPRPLVDEAIELAAALAPQAGSLLVNRDQHYANVLAAGREPWLVIDPKPVTGDVEFGVAPLLWRRFHQAGGPSGLRYRLAALIDAAELDTDLTRAWTLLHILDYWLWGLSAGLVRDPARCEIITSWLALARLP